MTRKPKLRGAVLAACMAVLLACGVAVADEVPLVTGEHWTLSTEQSKRVYLIGIANAYQVEQAYQGDNPAFASQTVVPSFAKGLKGQTLDSVRATLNRWYAEHPDQLKRPVIEAIWYEIVQPQLKTAK